MANKMTKEEALQKIKELEQFVKQQDLEINEECYGSLEMVQYEDCEVPFKMGKFLVTQGLWQAVMGENPSIFKGNPDLPVESVSWNHVEKFIKKLNELTGKNYRLPTEYEWMLCAQVDNTIYSGSDDIDKVAWYNDNSNDQTKPVGLKIPNTLGIYDMSGNVWEWCATEINSKRVLRGGSWLDNTRFTRVAYRNWYDPWNRSNYIGFRLAQ